MNTYVVFLQILPLLLGAAISPVATTGMITVLAAGKPSAIKKGQVYLLGTAVPLLVIGIPGIFLLSRIDIVPKNNVVGSWIDLVAGVILLGLAARLIFNPKKTANKNTHDKIHHTQSLDKILALGTALMITNFSTLVLFTPAIKDIASSSVDSVQKMTLLVISILITLSMIFTPLLIYIATPKKSEDILNSLKNFINKYMREITLSLLLVFGIYLLIRGFGVFGIKA